MHQPWPPEGADETLAPSEGKPREKGKESYFSINTTKQPRPGTSGEEREQAGLIGEGWTPTRDAETPGHWPPPGQMPTEQNKWQVQL